MRFSPSKLGIELTTLLVLYCESMIPYHVQFIFVTRTVVYAIGGNALASPIGGGEEESALVLAKVMSDVIDLLEAG